MKKGFKQLALAAVLAAPFMAQADLKSMDDSALAAVTGQDGISISGDFSGSIGNIAYLDRDGSTVGRLNLSNIVMDGFKITDDSPLTVDVVTTSIGGDDTQQLAIGLPSMTGKVTIGAINVGGAYASGALTGGSTLGGLEIADIDMGGTTVKIWGH
ncbi:DUF6160 family protein [Zestomonas thermotolerans]|uniref:DUF6160 family protein n=1 Tax=Zestomonas thermotolerans TaxID=157784 RepID=UPI00036202E6|nr:DUF6160 family protein [Pseudomonas thermotolerans]